MIWPSKNPSQLMFNIIEQVIFEDMLEIGRFKNRKPCGYIMNLPQEMRDILKELKSDDLKNIRYPV